MNKNLLNAFAGAILATGVATQQANATEWEEECGVGPSPCNPNLQLFLDTSIKKTNVNGYTDVTSSTVAKDVTTASTGANHFVDPEGIEEGFKNVYSHINADEINVNASSGIDTATVEGNAQTQAIGILTDLDNANYQDFHGVEPIPGEEIEYMPGVIAEHELHNSSVNAHTNVTDSTIGGNVNSVGYGSSIDIDYTGDANFDTRAITDVYNSSVDVGTEVLRADISKNVSTITNGASTVIRGPGLE